MGSVPTPHSLHVTRYDATGTAGWTTSLDDALAAPTDFGIGESRLEYGGGKYGAYFHVHGISGFANGHEGDALHWLTATSGAHTLGWNWGCSHSMSELLRYDSAAAKALPMCVTDCYPGTTGSNFPTDSIGGVYLDNATDVRNVDGGCNGSVAGELGGAAPARRVGSSCSTRTRTSRPMVELVLYVDDESGHRVRDHRDQQHAWRGRMAIDHCDEREQRLDRSLATGRRRDRTVRGRLDRDRATPVYKLARVTAAGAFIEGPVTMGARWGERDNPFRDHLNGDIVWSWFDAAGGTSFHFARVHSGGTATCAAL